ncbi:hypothetical protein DFH27DRAFT_640344 [Peziza echinospora]|nr:hypothetical protein DFH27DRAFT_640344 [Peziza echinospora]
MLLRIPSLQSIASLLPVLLISTLAPRPVLGGDILTTDGFSTCLNSDTLKITRMHLKYDRSTNLIEFDVGGISTKTQNVRAILKVMAYGRVIQEKEFDPCAEKIDMLCPVPEGRFGAVDSLTMPTEFASLIPDIAFQVPDLDGLARLELLSSDTGLPVACVESVVHNGKTANQPAVTYVTAGIAAAALVLSAVSAVGAAGAGGSAAGPSPNFGDVMFWFQSIATNGMLSVEYPPVYRSFAKNFAWSTGLVQWTQLQKSIDNFRSSTGGNTTENSVEYLMNATLVYTQNGADIVKEDRKRGLYAREDINYEQKPYDGNSTVEENGTVMKYVSGIEAYVEQLKIPSANTFMTVLLMFACLIAAIAVCILLFKVILEVWALFASFPKRLTGFRKRYWGFLAGTIVRIILILYGTWTLYCLYQFSRGDSWGAHLLAALTLIFFTAVLGFFVVKIFLVARRVKKAEGGSDALFLNKPYVRRYGLFYDQFKSNFWWIFVPMIVYAFTKAAFIALGDGHGLIQAAGQLACELMLLILLVWNRPFNTKAGNVLNIIISVVRVLSVLCLLVFVHELGIAADAKTVTGVALIAIQSSLTAALAVLLAINAIVVMCKDNPHERRRKELEKLQKEGNPTALESGNSILLGGGLGHDGKGYYRTTPTQETFPIDTVPHLGSHNPHEQYMHQRAPSSGTITRQSLIASAAPPGQYSPYEQYRPTPIPEGNPHAPYQPHGQSY